MKHDNPQLSKAIYLYKLITQIKLKHENSNNGRVNCFKRQRIINNKLYHLFSTHLISTYANVQSQNYLYTYTVKNLELNVLFFFDLN